MMRAATAFLLLTALLAAVTTSNPPFFTAILVVWGAICGSGARTAVFQLAARKGLTRIDDNARRYSSLGGQLFAAIAGAVVVVPAMFIPNDRFAIAAAGVIATAIGVVLGKQEIKNPRSPIRVDRKLWILSAALPAALIASAAAVCAGTLRLHTLDVVPPGEIARHLGGTSFLYAIFLGLGGFLKTFSEQKAGLVVVEKTEHAGPGPIVTGAIVGVAFLFLGTLLFPPMRFEHVLILKALLGFVLGGSLSALGALQGAKAASKG
jgi:hypothetical protein